MAPWSAAAPRGPRATTTRSLVIDEQHFEVTDREGEPGVYDFIWLDHPARYGFSCFRSDRSAMSEPEMVESIADFLAEINPETGYLD